MSYLPIIYISWVCFHQNPATSVFFLVRKEEKMLNEFEYIIFPTPYKLTHVIEIMILLSNNL